MLDTIDPGNSGGSVIIPELPKMAAVPTVYPCPLCDQVFENLEGQRQHRIESHPIERPYLTFSSAPKHLEKYVITQQLRPQDVQIDNADHIIIEGREIQNRDTAAELICSRKQGRVSVELVNQGYSALYDIHFDLIADGIAADVEEAFLESYQDGMSLVDVLNIFNERTAPFDPSAKGYVTALGNYLVAIMAKGRVEGCHIPHEEYPDRLGEALDRLASMRRPFASIVVSVIRLILNSFESSESDKAVPFLVATKAMLREGTFSNLKKGESSGGSLPVDYFTKKVILFAAGDDGYRASKAEELDALVSAPGVSESDKLKMHLALLAWCVHQQDKDGAERHYAHLRHVPEVRKYAETIHESMNHG